MAHKKVLFMVVCCLMTAKIDAGLLEKIHTRLLERSAYSSEGDCKFWGREDADPEVQKCVRLALQAMKVKNPNDVPVKRLISFSFRGITTPWGIWIKHVYPDSMYTCFHEAAHFAHGHSLKGTYLKIGTQFFLIATGLLGIIAVGKNSLPSALAASLFLYGAWSSRGRKLLDQGSNRLAYYFYPKEFREAEADALAVKTLYGLSLEQAVPYELRLKYAAGIGVFNQVTAIFNHNREHPRLLQKPNTST